MDEQDLKHSLLRLYQRLFERYGPQHWWPAEERYEIIIGSILTQAAAWTNVSKAIANLKQASAMTPQAIRLLPQEELSQLIYPCGYYQTKARKLKAFARWLKDRYDDDLERLFAQETAALRQELLSVYGIGEETADAIILYAAGKPIFVIDAYTRRILTRLGITPEGKGYTAWQNLFMQHLPPDVQLFNEYHALLVRLGKEVCRAKPLCQLCCLNTAPAQKSPYPCRNFSGGSKN